MEAGAYQQFAEEEQSHWWFQGRKAIFCHLVSRLLPARRAPGVLPARILDLGCGMGGMLGPLSRLGRVLGLDPYQEALAFCASRGFALVCKGLGTHIPLPDSSLDLVTAFDTLEHIPEELETLRECQRVLRPGGRLVISVPAYQWLYTLQDKMVHHQRRYTARDLRRKLERLGFQIQESSYINFLLFPIILPVVLSIKIKQSLLAPPQGRYFSNASIKVPRFANRLLCAIFSFERHLVCRLTVPAGHSLLVIAKKPARSP